MALVSASLNVAGRWTKLEIAPINWSEDFIHRVTIKRVESKCDN